MVINKKKCGLIKHRGTLKTEWINIDGQDIETFEKIPVKEEYKYLGIIMDKNMNLKRHVEKIVEKNKKGMKMISIVRWKKFSLWHAYYIWNTYVASRMRYGSLIYYKADLNGHLDVSHSPFAAI